MIITVFDVMDTGDMFEVLAIDFCATLAYSCVFFGPLIYFLFFFTFPIS